MTTHDLPQKAPAVLAAGADDRRPLDKHGPSERSSLAPARIGRASVRTLDGDAGESAARKQGEALLAIARSFRLLDEKEDD